MSKTKEYQQYLVLDWKTGESRTRKSKPGPGDLGANELVAELHVSANIPEVETSVLAVEIDVPEPQVYQATIDALDEDDLPDWSDTAAEVLENEREAILAADVGEVRNIADRLTTEVLIDAPGRPSADHVRDYLFSTAKQMRNDREVEA